MDLRADSGPAPTHATVGVAALEQEMPLSSARCPTESDGTILLQLLEFKTHLLEAVEELHIRRDAETRFEDQISRLVLEKQELEWEKESQQHQAETVVNQHTESLINIKKQFQAKIRNIEEEKGKYQVSAELKDKEINNLKEELKSLQLLKYNLEKKSNELEQKQALQSRSKDSHLNQLGEVEKRFSALSRHCAMVKQAHEKLEQNVDEAMKMNTKLTFANGKQEATIVSLKTELEEVRNKLIKAKMSSVRHDTTQIPTGRDQHIQQLLQKLNMETEMNKRLGEENVGVRAEKQEVMRSLQHTQQLLLSQTQTVSTVEMELQTQREQYQGLKKEHEVMREQSKAMEERLAQLMESYAASQSSWDKEKAKFLDQIKSEHQDVHAAREAYDKLQLKHTELSSQPKVQAQHICESEIKDSSESLSVSNQLFPTLVEEIRGEETLIEPSSISVLPSLSSLKSLTSTLTENPDKGAVTKLVATGATGGQDPLNHHQQSQIKQPLKPSNPFTCSSTKNNNLLSLCSHSGTTGRDSSINQYLNNSDVCMQISKGSGVSDTSTISSPDHRSEAENADLLSKKKERDEGIGGMIRKEQGLKDDETEGKNNRLQSENDEEQQWSREDVKDRGSSGEHRKTLMVQTTDRADRQEDSQRSTEDSGDTTRPGTETKDIAAKIVLNTPETESAQTSADTTTEKSNTPQFIDSMDTESPTACESSDCSLSLLKEVSEKDADTSHVKISRGEHPSFSDEHQSVCLGPNSVDHKVQRGHGEVQISTQDAQSLTLLTSPIDGVHEKTVEENRSAAYTPTTLPEPENQSNVCSSPINAASLAAQSDDTGSIQELEATSTQTQPGNPSNITCYMRQTNVMRDKHVSKECVSVTTLVEPKVTRQSQEISEQQSELTKYLVTNDDNFSECKKRKGQLKVDAHENDAGDAQEPVEESNLKEVCEEITMDTVDLESDVETGNFPQVKNDQIDETEHAKTTKQEIDLKLSDNSRHEKEASPETGRTKCYDQFPANETLSDDTNDTSLPSIKTFRSSFGWSIAPRKSESPLSEQNTSGPSRVLGPSPCTIPMFLKSKHSKVPLVITRASDLLNASSVCGTAASSWIHQQGETHREPATADTKKRASPSISSFPVSPSSITDSRRQTTPGCSSGPSSAAGRNSESDWELPLSQEREDQQTSFRTQISKIEQFLNTERLRLPKRRKTDN